MDEEIKKRQWDEAVTRACGSHEIADLMEAGDIDGAIRALRKLGLMGPDRPPDDEAL